MSGIPGKERKTRRNIAKILSQKIGDTESVGEKTCRGSQAYAARDTQHETEGGGTHAEAREMPDTEARGVA